MRGIKSDQIKEYRILALAVAFFIIGLFFFLQNNASQAPTQPQSLMNQSVSVKSAQGSPSFEPEFANFPPPSQFQTLTNDANGLNGSDSLSITATCHDVFLAVLIFPSRFDYRSDVSKEVYNQASPCQPGQAFHKTISKTEMENLPFGTYYVIVADQGTTGTWYNPR